MIEVRHIREVQWGTSKIIVDLTVADVDNSRVFEMEAVIEGQVFPLLGL